MRDRPRMVCAHLGYAAYARALPPSNYFNQPLHCGFFARKISFPRYGGVSKALARVAGPCTGRPTLFILPPVIGLAGDRLTTCLQGQSS